jgi:hypothetical protein
MVGFADQPSRGARLHTRFQECQAGKPGLRTRSTRRTRRPGCAWCPSSHATGWSNHYVYGLRAVPVFTRYGLVQPLCLRMRVTMVMGLADHAPRGARLPHPTAWSNHYVYGCE